MGHLQHRNRHFRKPNHKLFPPPSLQKYNPTFSNCFTPPPNASSHSSPLPLFSCPQFPNLKSSHPLPPFVDFVIVQKTLNYTMYPYTWCRSTEFPPLPFLLDFCYHHFLYCSQLHSNPFNTGTAIMLSSLLRTLNILHFYLSKPKPALFSPLKQFNFNQKPLASFPFNRMWRELLPFPFVFGYSLSFYHNQH